MAQNNLFLEQAEGYVNVLEKSTSRVLSWGGGVEHHAQTGLERGIRCGRIADPFSAHPVSLNLTHVELVITSREFPPDTGPLAQTSCDAWEESFRFQDKSIWAMWPRKGVTERGKPIPAA